MHNYSAVISSPVGRLGLICHTQALYQLDFLPADADLIAAQDEFTLEVIKQLNAYFSGECLQFSLSLVEKGTPFQHAVWQAMRQISPGTTMTYGQLAKQLNSSPRAVGNACRRNPIPIVTPCHRIVGATSIGGYSGTTQGDAWSIKQWLLRHEMIAY